MLRAILLVLALFLATSVCSDPGQAPNHTISQDLRRRQCLWDPNSQDWNCPNNYPPTLAQLVYALRDTQNLGNVGPGKIMFFYTNLFEPGDPRPSFEKQLQVFDMCIGWLIAYSGFDFDHILSSVNALTRTGNQWLRKNEDYIINGPDVMKQYIASLFPSPNYAVWNLGGCTYQGIHSTFEVQSGCANYSKAMALSYAEPEVYLFVSPTSQSFSRSTSTRVLARIDWSRRTPCHPPLPACVLTELRPGQIKNPTRTVGGLSVSCQR